MTIRRAIVVVAALAIATLALRACWRRLPRAGQPAVARLAGVYQIAWHGSTDAAGQQALGLPEAHGAVDLAGQLALRPLGERRLGLRFTRLDRAAGSILGRPLIAEDAAALVGVEVVVELDPAGAVTGVALPPGAPAALGPLARAIAVQAQVTPGADGEVAADGLFGRTRFRYQRAGAAVHRTRVGYDALDALPPRDCAGCTRAISGEARIELDGAGALTALDDREAIRVTDGAETVLAVDNHFTLTRGGLLAAAPAPDTERWTRWDLASAYAVAEDQALRDQAGDLTLDTIASWVLRHAATGAVPSEPAWLGRVAAYLTLHPDDLDHLVELFEAPGLPDAGRLLVLDMLVATGTDRAQAALLRALDAGAERPDDVHALMISRLAFVEEPGPELAARAAALRTEVAAGDPRLAQAALYAHGSVIGHLAAVDRDAAIAAARGLEAELAAADQPAARAQLVDALGNADLDETVDTLVALAADDAPEVRIAVATALRARGGDRAGQALVALAGDPDAGVQRAALHAIAHGAADPGDLGRLAGEVVAGRFPAAADGDLVAALARGVGRQTGAEEALAVVLERSGGNPQLAAEIRALFEG